MDFDKIIRQQLPWLAGGCLSGPSTLLRSAQDSRPFDCGGGCCWATETRRHIEAILQASRGVEGPAASAQAPLRYPGSSSCPYDVKSQQYRFIARRGWLPE